MSNQLFPYGLGKRRPGQLAKVSQLTSVSSSILRYLPLRQLSAAQTVVVAVAKAAKPPAIMKVKECMMAQVGCLQYSSQKILGGRRMEKSFLNSILKAAGPFIYKTAVRLGDSPWPPSDPTPS